MEYKACQILQDGPIWWEVNWAFPTRRAHDSWYAQFFLGINALASSRALEEGRHVHMQIMQSGCQLDAYVGSSLTEFVATFVSLLLACSHAGLLDEGLVYFDSMCSVYGISATVKHYMPIWLISWPGQPSAGGRGFDQYDVLWVHQCCSVDGFAWAVHAEFVISGNSAKTISRERTMIIHPPRLYTKYFYMEMGECVAKRGPEIGTWTPNSQCAAIEHLCCC